MQECVDSANGRNAVSFERFCHLSLASYVLYWSWLHRDTLEQAQQALEVTLAKLEKARDNLKATEVENESCKTAVQERESAITQLKGQEQRIIKSIKDWQMESELNEMALAELKQDVEDSQKTARELQASVCRLKVRISY